jgi:MFS family permease
MPLLLVALTAMLAQQTMATVAKSGVPILFKPIADDLGFSSELVLLYTWTFACVGIVVMLGCGPFITRFGALRMTQAGCVCMAVGLCALSLTTTPLWLASGVLAVVAGAISVGATMSTPASSQILARYSPARWAPLVFSIKQAGVPAGVVIASFAAPWLTAAVGWRNTGLVLGTIAFGIALVLQPCRREFDKDRRPGHRLSIASLKETFFDVLTMPGLSTLASTAFAFIGLQSIYTTFTVVYLAEELNYGLEQAGAMLGLATLVAAPGRIFWGWIASTWIRPRVLLIGLAVAMSFGAAAMGFFTPKWSETAVFIPLFIVSATALSWHGILLAEVARLSPQAQVGRMTGGVLAFGTAGQITFPLIFGIGYLFGGYVGAFIAVALPALVIAAALARAEMTRDTSALP